MSRRNFVSLNLPRDGHNPRATSGQTAVVAGGGLAGVAAATVLAERGVAVVLVEKHSDLGGRAGGWTDRLATGETFEMERGFHAFFRQYYNLRSLLRRVDPELSCFQPTDDYPVLGPGGRVQSFSGLPIRPPWNVIALTRRASTLRFTDLLKVDKMAALAMMRYERDWTFGGYDEMTASDYLASLNFPPEAHRMLFDVFARSFFNPYADMSAAEMLMMFHFYFVGNSEGLIFDVARKPFSTAIWRPLRKYLEELGVDVRTECRVEAVEKGETCPWRVKLDDGNGDGDGAESVEADHVVLALDVAALQSVVDGSPDLDDAGFRSSIASLATTNPFVVWRLWLDKPANPGRKPFVGTTGIGPLDNISLYDLLEDESRDWAARNGGAVAELHAYGVPRDFDEAKLREELLQAFHAFYPEFADARIIEERFLIRDDCPAFAPGSDSVRPPVETAHDGIVLAGDFVRMPLPSALMERAVGSGYLAANTLLAPQGIKPEPILSVPLSGLLGRRPRLEVA
jgi:isorenieratene synthase